MAKEYTGEVIPEAKAAQGASAKPYTGEVIPLSGGGAARPDQPVPPPLSAGGDSTSGFISGNLNKGIASLLGAPMDTMRNALNLGVAGVGTHARESLKDFGVNYVPPEPMGQPRFGSRGSRTGYEGPG